VVLQCGNNYWKKKPIDIQLGSVWAANNKSGKGKNSFRLNYFEHLTFFGLNFELMAAW
jgi:hypothetical protein